MALLGPSRPELWRLLANLLHTALDVGTTCGGCAEATAREVVDGGCLTVLCGGCSDACGRVFGEVDFYYLALSAFDGGYTLLIEGGRELFRHWVRAVGFEPTTFSLWG